MFARVVTEQVGGEGKSDEGVEGRASEEGGVIEARSAVISNR